MLLKNPVNRFDEIYSIYEEAFPAIERRTKEGQKQVLKESCYQLRVVEEFKTILAFLGFWDLESCVFLEHLATTARCRGKGYGKILVEELLSDTKKPVFLEIEPVTEQNPITVRRAEFYKRLGFCVNTFPYEQMPLKKGDAPIPLLVMSYGKTIKEEEFAPYKKEIYKTVYGIEEKGAAINHEHQ